MSETYLRIKEAARVAWEDYADEVDGQYPDALNCYPYEILVDHALLAELRNKAVLLDTYAGDIYDIENDPNRMTIEQRCEALELAFEAADERATLDDARH